MLSCIISKLTAYSCSIENLKCFNSKIIIISVEIGINRCIIGVKMLRIGIYLFICRLIVLELNIVNKCCWIMLNKLLF